MNNAFKSLFWHYIPGDNNQIQIRATGLLVLLEIGLLEIGTITLPQQHDILEWNS